MLNEGSRIHLAAVVVMKTAQAYIFVLYLSVIRLILFHSELVSLLYNLLCVQPAEQQINDKKGVEYGLTVTYTEMSTGACLSSPPLFFPFLRILSFFSSFYSLPLPILPSFFPPSLRSRTP